MTERLTKADWIRHGLRTLSTNGSKALTVGSMATRLKVSRGSFYWHFQDIGAFRAELLQSWREVSTDQVIRDLDARGSDPERLKRLLRSALGGPRKLDRAIRSWAEEEEEVAKVVASVDERRVERIAGLLVDAGLDTQRANHRGAFLYWAYLGQAIVMHQRHASIPDWALDEISDLFERPHANVSASGGLVDGA
jgi:AcrR family transcriptional regulator